MSFDVDSLRTNGVCERLKNDPLNDILVLIPETSERYLIWQKKEDGWITEVIKNLTEIILNYLGRP